MHENNLILLLAVITSFLFFLIISPMIFHDSIVQWHGSLQKMMFSGVCHQDPARTVHLNGIPAAVCSRCLGIYAFLSIGFIIIPFFREFLIRNFRYSKATLLAATVLLLSDFGMQWLGVYEGSNLSRFLTGSALGLATTIFIICNK